MKKKDKLNLMKDIFASYEVFSKYDLESSECNSFDYPYILKEIKKEIPDLEKEFPLDLTKDVDTILCEIYDLIEKNDI